ncbi:guanine nucleotide-binding subunit alpha-12 isoform X2 [Labeo rohita]|uniref:Guanine nucleotide-binding subunit alpha-12 isoform X2 n=1 Tax=Labeo rohita TaxID=84645 RepID=A0A498NTH9_LABRO|nr:guanine nucleotide-binding subunit alpha-12 isoform X2 [Labeo rohita]
MQQSDEASWAPSTRPKRQLRQPSYLKDYEVSAVRPKVRGPSRASTTPLPPREEDRGSQPHVKWGRPIEAHDDYLPTFEESYNDTSLGWRHTPMPFTGEGAEPSWSQSDSVQYSSASLYDTRRESLELPASTRVEGAVQHDQVLDHWPMPPLLLPEDSLVPEVEEAEVELPPPPWPSSNYPPKSAVVGEQRVVIVIDRMMSELQLMRDSMTSSITAHTRPHSTPRNLNPPQPRRGPEQDEGSPTARPTLCSPISRSQPRTYHTDVGSLTQRSTTSNINRPQPARDRQFSPVSVTQGGGEYRGPAPKIPLFVRNDPMEFSRLKLALSNLLPVDAPELFKYQILVDHVKLEDACLIADSFINSPRPYTDTMAALTEKFGQPHHVALKRIAAVMDSPEIKRGDSAAFERFSLHVQSLVGMLQTLGPDGEVELKCGSHVARLLTKLPIEMRANFRR